MFRNRFRNSFFVVVRIHSITYSYCVWEISGELSRVGPGRVLVSPFVESDRTVFSGVLYMSGSSWFLSKTGFSYRHPYFGVQKKSCCMMTPGSGFPLFGVVSTSGIVSLGVNRYNLMRGSTWVLSDPTNSCCLARPFQRRTD